MYPLSSFHPVQSSVFLEKGIEVGKLACTLLPSSERVLTTGAKYSSISWAGRTVNATTAARMRNRKRRMVIVETPVCRLPERKGVN